jgi:predicted Holliday junction resolvase-like endonuclease
MVVFVEVKSGKNGALSQREKLVRDMHQLWKGKLRNYPHRE